MNSIKILKKNQMFDGTKSQIDIPLCQMLSLQVIWRALAIDIEKMKVDFIHCYHPGAAMFYVSTTDFAGIKRVVEDKDRARWSKCWHSQDKKFEIFIASNSELRVLSNKFLFIWDRNHWLVAWTDFIDRLYHDNYEWHY